MQSSVIFVSKEQTSDTTSCVNKVFQGVFIYKNPCLNIFQMVLYLIFPDDLVSVNLWVSKLKIYYLMKDVMIKRYWALSLHKNSNINKEMRKCLRKIGGYFLRYVIGCVNIGFKVYIIYKNICKTFFNDNMNGLANVN